MLKHSKIDIAEFNDLANAWIENIPFLQKAKNTEKAYLKAIKDFMEYLTRNETETINLLTVTDYKAELLQRYAVKTVNLKLTVINRLFKDIGFNDIKINLVKDESGGVNTKGLTENEYFNLLEWAGKLGKKKMELIIRTLAGTGIRIGELSYLTVESLNSRTFNVTNKGKTRTAFIPAKLNTKLKKYCKDNNIKSGVIFRGRPLKDKSGNLVKDNKGNITYTPIDPSYIRRELKVIAGKARGNLRQKAFPHNLRHALAVNYTNTPGTNPYLLPTILGHSVKQVTSIYTEPPSVKDILKMLDLVEKRSLEAEKNFKKRPKRKRKKVNKN